MGVRGQDKTRQDFSYGQIHYCGRGSVFVFFAPTFDKCGFEKVVV